MSDCASILSSATSPHHQDTRAKRRAARLRLPMTVRIPQFYHQVADEHEMSDDQYSSSDNEAFEEVILLPPVADEGENSYKFFGANSTPNVGKFHLSSSGLNESSEVGSGVIPMLLVYSVESERRLCFGLSDRNQWRPSTRPGVAY